TDLLIALGNRLKSAPERIEPVGVAGELTDNLLESCLGSRVAPVAFGYQIGCEDSIFALDELDKQLAFLSRFSHPCCGTVQQCMPRYLVFGQNMNSHCVVSESDKNHGRGPSPTPVPCPA